MLQSVFCLGVVVTNLHDGVHADVVSHSTTDRALRAKPAEGTRDGSECVGGVAQIESCTSAYPFWMS